MSLEDGFWRCSDEDLLACSASGWSGDRATCRWCDKPLEGRRRRWCSDECGNTMAANHYWSAASHRRCRTDGYRCVDCHGLAPREAYASALENGVGEKFARRRIRLEVHHLTPVLGRHAVSGCHHHQDGLVTVCLWHHVWRHRELRDWAAQLALA